jgi:hypothetical protein
MTEKKIAQIQQMQRLSKGPVTQEGRERIRFAHWKHGVYSKAEQATLRALGEEPDDFLAVLEGLRSKVLPRDAADDLVVANLARALWRTTRADRIREGNTLRQARSAEDAREGKMCARLLRVKVAAETLRLMLAQVSQPYFVATIDTLKRVTNFCANGDLDDELANFVLSLFYDLRAPGIPGRDEPGPAPRQNTFRQFKALLGMDGSAAFISCPATLALGESAQPGEDADSGGSESHLSKARYPQITDDEWAVREPLRQLLENLLKRQVEIFDARCQTLLKEIAAEPTCYDRAAELTPTHPDYEVIQRFEDAGLRHAHRLVDLLAKLRQLGAGEE